MQAEVRLLVLVDHEIWHVKAAKPAVEILGRENDRHPVVNGREEFVCVRPAVAWNGTERAHFGLTPTAQRSAAANAIRWRLTIRQEEISMSKFAGKRIIRAFRRPSS
jgi:hypothetical protein